jgi:hypothetical protein
MNDGRYNQSTRPVGYYSNDNGNGRGQYGIMALFAPHAVKLAVTAKTPAIVISFLPNGKTPRGFMMYVVPFFMSN